ncbi:hypothetical protein ACQJBY_021956 [Aegilops geniculata]
MEAPLTVQIVEFNTKVMQEELKKLGLKVNHHEANITFLKSEIYAIEESIADLTIKRGKKVVASSNGTSVQEAEQRTIESICNQDKTAASLICQLKKRHSAQISTMPMMKDILGVVATLGKTNDDNLSSLLSEYLGIDNMLGLVCKTYDGIKSLETYGTEGNIDKKSGIHGLGGSIGKLLHGRFTVFCLENIRPFSGEVVIDDPQRYLMLRKPRLPNGESPPGFLGFAVNMILMDQAYLSCLTPHGHGLRETLFYSLFSHLQVYKTTADLRRAIPFINDGAVSLDGGILRPNGSFCLGDRKDVEVKFSVALSSGDSNTPGSITEMEEQVKLKNWEKERLVEDIKREEDLLKQVKDSFSNQKQQLLDYITQSPAGKRVQGSPTIRSPATPGSNPFAATPGRNPFTSTPGSHPFATTPGGNPFAATTPGGHPIAATPGSHPIAATPGNISFAVKPPHMR